MRNLNNYLLPLNRIAAAAECFEVAVVEYFGAERRNVSRQAEKVSRQASVTHNLWNPLSDEVAAMFQPQIRTEKI